MGKKRPERAARRMAERVARGLVRDREKLWALEAGGSAARAIEVASSAVIEVKARATPCPQCGGRLDVEEHLADDATGRRLRLRCAQCGVRREMFFRLASAN